MAKNINHAIQKKLNAAQSGIEEPTRSTSVFTGNRAKQLCELIKEVHDHLPKNLTRKEKEILITEGIAERVAYTRFSKMGWKATEQDEFQKIVVNLECLEGPYLMADVRKRCGPEDTIAFLAYVYTRKGIEKDKEGFGTCKVRCVYVGDRIHNMITGMVTKILSESRRPPAAGWEIDLQTDVSQILGLNHTRGVDITSAFPAVPILWTEALCQGQGKIVGMFM